MQTTRSADYYVTTCDFMQGPRAFGDDETLSCEDELALSDGLQHPCIPIRTYFDARYHAAYTSWRNW